MATEPDTDTEELTMDEIMEDAACAVALLDTFKMHDYERAKTDAVQW